MSQIFSPFFFWKKKNIGWGNRERNMNYAYVGARGLIVMGFKKPSAIYSLNKGLRALTSITYRLNFKHIPQFPYVGTA